MRRLAVAACLLISSLTLIIPMPQQAEGSRKGRLTSAHPHASPAGSARLTSAQTQQSAATIIRTIVYRQITEFQSGGSVGSILKMKMS